MAIFKIYGAHADSGEKLSVSVQAESPAEVEAIARHRRIMIDRIVEVESAATQVLVAPPTAPPPVARMPQMGYPSSQVPGHSAYAPTLNVNLPKRSSSLGIVSFVLGTVALLICWIPLIGILSIPISGLGLLLAVIGFFVAVARKGGGIGWPIGGGLLAGIALIIGLFQVAMVRGAAKAMNDAEQERVQTNQRTVPSGGTGRQEDDSTAPTSSGVMRWASAENAVRQGDAELRITSVTVSTVQIKQAFGDSVSSSKEPQLVIKLELRNVSETKKLNYQTWAGGDFSFGRDFCTLQDNFGNTYKRVTFGSMSKPLGRVESDSIYPGKSLTDVLVFEPPLDKAEYLDLELPGGSIGGEGMFRLRIPAKMVKR